MLLHTLWALLGTAVLVAVAVDVLATTLSLGGHGPLSRRIVAVVRHVVDPLARLPSLRRCVFRASGPATIAALAVSWFALLWTGWGLVFLADPGAIVNTSTGQPATAAEVFYFAGFTVTTLGIGDIAATSTLFRMLTVFAAASGFMLISVVVSYVLSVVSAVVSKRQLASQISAIGDTPSAFIQNASDGSGYAGLALQLPGIASMLGTTQKQLLAYPVLHRFKALERSSDLASSVAILDDALAVIGQLEPPARTLPAALVRPVEGAVGDLARSLEQEFVAPAKHAPPLPRLGFDPAGMERVFEPRSDRRRRLLGWVRDAGYDWPT